MLKPFRGLAGQVHCVPIVDHDSRPPDKLAALATELGFRSTANESLAEALTRVSAPARVLIFGSLYLAGVALKANGQIPD